jgi:hypothetical protein
VIASPALAHTKPGPRPTSKAVVTSTAAPAPTLAPPTFGGPGGDGDNDGGRHGRGGHGPKGDFAPITQTVTVDVPDTGSYQLLVTEVKPAKAPAKPVGAPDHSFTVPVTGTGSQTVTLNLPHPGDYKVSLISVVSTQSITVAAPTK